MRYDPSSERYELRTARVYHPDGSVDEGTQVDEFNVSSDPSTRMYFSNRVVQVTFPTSRRGDVVELRWRVDDVSFRNAFADYFGDLQVVQAPVPRALSLRAPRPVVAGVFRAHRGPSGGSCAHPRRARRGRRPVRPWSADDVPAVPPEERAPGQTERAAYLHVSTYRDWAEVGRWYWGLVRDQLVADDRLRAASCASSPRGLTTDRDRCAPSTAGSSPTPATWRWSSASTASSPTRCRRSAPGASATAKTRRAVIVTMLREAGVDASLVLLRTRANGNVATEPASLAVSTTPSRTCPRSTSSSTAPRSTAGWTSCPAATRA
jgi:hypothetical protein